MQRGITMAVEEINAAGGIEGIKFEAAIEDHQGVPRVGVDALERLLARYDIQAVLLSYSTVGLACAPICEEQKIFMLDGGSVTDGLVGKVQLPVPQPLGCVGDGEGRTNGAQAGRLQEDGADGVINR